MRPKLIVALVLAGLLAVFTLQNSEVVVLRFLFWKLETSRAFLLLGMLAVGVLIGWLLASLARHSRGR